MLTREQMIIMAAYQVIVWAVGTASGGLRAMLDDPRPDCPRLTAIAGIAGFLAWGIICGVLERGPHLDANGVFQMGKMVQGVALAGIIGAAGREVTDKLIARMALAMLDGTIRILKAIKGVDNNGN